jgi:hypothetical protein
VAKPVGNGWFRGIRAQVIRRVGPFSRVTRTRRQTEQTLHNAVEVAASERRGGPLTSGHAAQALQTWTTRWLPSSARLSGCGRKTCYWLRRDEDGLQRAYLGLVSQAPTGNSAPHYYLNGSRVFRDWGHPDGPSSIPYFRIRGHKVYPAEGFLVARTDCGTKALAADGRRTDEL